MSARPNATVAVIDITPPLHSQEAAQSEAPFRRFHGLSLLEWCVRRLKESTMLDAIVITGTQHQRELVMSDSLCGARWLPSVQTSGLARLAEVASRANAEWLIFASPTCPFTDPVLLDRMIASAWSNPGFDFLGYFAPNAPRLCLAKLGLVAEMCNRRVIDQLMADEDSSRVMTMGQRIQSSSHLFQTRMIPLPAALQREELRFNLESIEDWDTAYAYLEAVGEDVSWQNLASLSLPS